MNFEEGFAIYLDINDLEDTYEDKFYVRCFKKRCYFYIDKPKDESGLYYVKEAYFKKSKGEIGIKVYYDSRSSKAELSNITRKNFKINQRFKVLCFKNTAFTKFKNYLKKNPGCLELY